MSQVILSTKAGHDYKFDLFDIDSELPSLGGIYTVLSHRAGKYIILYIGRSNDIKVRHGSHHKADCFTENGATHIGFHREDDENKRVLLEFLLQSNYLDLSCTG